MFTAGALRGAAHPRACACCSAFHSASTPSVCMSQAALEVKGAARAGGLGRFWPVWAFLLAGLLATSLATHLTKSKVDSEEKADFDFACKEIEGKIVDRFRAHEQILRSAAAFFTHSSGVDRQEWRRFTERQQLEHRLPGIQGLGFSRLIPRANLAQHIQEIRAEGFPAYDVFPKGDRELYSSIVYLEPFTNRNLRAFGYDMFNEPVRREAMERARDLDTAALSGKVTLVQETSKDVQAGTLMYVPVYRPGLPIETAAQRREAILGWAYSPYRMNDLLEGILGSWDQAGQRRMQLEIYDGDRIAPETKLFDSQAARNGQPTPAAEPRLAVQRQVKTAGRHWALRITRIGNPADPVDYSKVWLVGVGGLSSSLLMAGLFLSILKGRDQAWQFAAELKRSEERYRTMMDSSPHAVFLAGEDGVIMMANQAAANLNGRARPQDLAGERLPDLFQPGHRASVQAAVEAAMRQGFASPVECLLQRADGALTATELSGAIVKDFQGQPKVFLAIAQDITERKRMEKEKEQMAAQQRLVQKAESLNRMAGAVAHHFNNQLGAAMMSLDLARHGLSHGPSATGPLKDAMAAVRRAAEVSSLMLTYLGQAPSVQEPVELALACQLSLARLHETVPRGVRLVPQLPQPGPVIDSNVNQIQQILANLASNAGEAYAGGPGVVQVAVRTATLADIAPLHRFPIDSEPQAVGYGCLEVVDQGCGIAAHDIERIFDPFFSTKFTGRGLGLPVVLGIVRAHNGFVTVESQPGRGSTFRVFLPLSAKTITPKPSPPLSIRKTVASGTVLVVEDNATLLSVLVRAFKLLGYSVQQAGDGVEAVELFKQHRDEICCVVTDLTMPRMNGWETIAAVRKIAPGVPVILASGYSESEALKGDHPELPQAFLSKPYDFDELSGALARVLGVPKQDQASGS